MIAPWLLLASLAAAAPGGDADVIAYVNGVAITRSAAKDRAWKRYGPLVISEMSDDILTRQAANVLGVKADPVETEARLKRMQAQFKDKEEFKAHLAAVETNVAEIKAGIEEQLLREALLVKAKGIKVPEAEVKAYFEANKDSLGVPESVRLRQIVVETEEDAGRVQRALKAGADFAKLAYQVSAEAVTKKKGGDRGMVAKGSLPPEIDAVVFALKPGEVSAPVKSPQGLSLYKVEEILPAKPAVFDDIRQDLTQAMFAGKFEKAWPAYIQELRDKAVTKRGPKAATAP